MDRYFCIVVPPYRSKLTPHRVLLLTLGTWFIACVVFVPVVLWFREQEVLESRLICTIVFPNVPTVSVSTAFTVVMVVLACLLPLALLVYYYCAIFRKLVETKKVRKDPSLHTQWGMSTCWCIFGYLPSLDIVGFGILISVRPIYPQVYNLKLTICWFLFGYFLGSILACAEETYLFVFMFRPTFCSPASRTEKNSSWRFGG